MPQTLDSTGDAPPGSILLDAHDDPIVVWPDRSYGRPDGMRMTAPPSRSFGPYRLLAQGLDDEACALFVALCNRLAGKARKA